MYTTLPNNDIPISLIADIITYLGTNPILISDIGKLQEYTGYGKSYIKSGLTVIKMLELIDVQQSDVRLIANQDAVSLLGKTPNNDTKIQVIRKYIQMYEPFVTFVEFCMNDNSLQDAARKVYTLYEFRGKDATFLKKLFLSWGQSTNIFSESAETIYINTEIGERYQRYITPELTLNDDMAIRLHIMQRLGEEASLLLEECDMTELVDAFKKYQTDPRDSIGATGRAFENYLRRFAKIPSVGIDVSRKSGITQIISSIYSGGYVHSKHNQISMGLGDIRNMSGHGIDPRDYEPWALQTESALAYVELVLSTMKSIYQYKVNNLLIF